MLAEMVRVLPVDRWRRPCGTRRGRQVRSPAAVKPNVILRAAFAKAAAHRWLAVFLAAFAWAGIVQAPGFTHEKPRAERDGRPQNRASSPALRGAPVSEPERVFAKRAELLKRSHA